MGSASSTTPGRDRFLRRIANRRGIDVPSLIADRRVASHPDVVPDDDMLAEGLTPRRRSAGTDSVSSWRERLSPSRVTEGAAVFPMLILFGLNMVDELDRSAYNVLIPEVRRAFDLDIQGITTVTGIALIAAYLIQVPIGYYADRHSRIRIATGGAAVWGFFTLMTGLAPTIALLAVSRGMTAIGRAVNDPTHNSLDRRLLRAQGPDQGLRLPPRR